MAAKSSNINGLDSNIRTRLIRSVEILHPFGKNKKSLPLDEPVAGTISDETVSFIYRFDLARL
jgi:hypothetical protein